MIQFENVTKKYAGMASEVVTNVNFTVPDGQIFVLIGPSGCGKTTCLKMINRLIRITSGRILIEGTDIRQIDPIELRRNMGYVIQQTGLFPHMTVRENIEIIPRLAKKDAEDIMDRTEELMRMVGLDPEEYLDRYPTQLSGGQLQRVGVARAFAMDPQIILMDEPFSALDPITRSQLQDELLFMQNKLKKTIVFVTHDMDEAVKLGNHICIINEGRVVQCDTPEEIMKHPADDYVSDFVGRNRIWGNPQLIRVSDIMLTDPLVLPDGLSLIRALGQMKKKHVTSALVADADHRYAGLVLASDIQECPDISAPLSSLIRKDGPTVRPQTDLLELLALVKEKNASVLPVVDADGVLKGLITRSSLVTTLSRQYEETQTEDPA